VPIELARAALAATLCFAPPSEPSSDAPARSLDAALAREARVLSGEKGALEAALADVERSAKTSRQGLESDIESLAKRLAILEAENAALERSMPARERPRAIADQQRHLEGLINDMRSWLETRRVQMPEHSTDDRGDPARLPPLVARVLDHVHATGRLHVDDEAAYFGPGGEPRSAPVLRVGEVAAVAWGDESHALIDTPAGLIAAEGVEPDRHETPAGTRVRAVLYEADAVPDPGEFAVANWRTRMAQGGSLMWVLFAFALVAIGVAVERTGVLLWMTWRWRAAATDPVAAERSQMPPWLEPAVAALAAMRRGEVRSEDTLVQSLLVLRQRAFRRISILGLVAAAAPLTGLLGTVTGMIATFTVVTERGTSDPQALAGGISEALLTTQFGLAIAIPVLLVHVGLQRGARRLVGRAEATMLAAYQARAPSGEEGADPLSPSPANEEREEDES